MDISHYAEPFPKQRIFWVTFPKFKVPIVREENKKSKGVQVNPKKTLNN